MVNCEKSYNFLLLWCKRSFAVTDKVYWFSAWPTRICRCFNGMRNPFCSVSLTNNLLIAAVYFTSETDVNKLHSPMRNRLRISWSCANLPARFYNVPRDVCSTNVCLQGEGILANFNHVLITAMYIFSCVIFSLDSPCKNQHFRFCKALTMGTEKFFQQEIFESHIEADFLCLKVLKQWKTLFTLSNANIEEKKGF